jgi:hypothetical protein
MKKSKILTICFIFLVLGCEKPKTAELSPNDILIKRSPWVLNPKYHTSISNCQDTDIWKQYFDSVYYEEYYSDGSFHVEGRNMDNCAFTDKYTQVGFWILSDNSDIIDYNTDGESTTATIIKMSENELVYKYYETTYYLIPKK